MLGLVGCSGDGDLNRGRGAGVSMPPAVAAVAGAAAAGVGGTGGRVAGVNNIDQAAAGAAAAAASQAQAGVGGTAAAAGTPAPTVSVPATPDRAEPCSVIGCPPGLVCAADGVCVTPPPACSADADCGAGERCGVTGECLGPDACRVNADCGDAQSCRDQVCTLGTDCGQTELTIEPVPPNVLILLDVSQSMNDPLSGGLCLFPPCPPSKMEIASAAMNSITAAYRDRIRWGFASFPGDGACGPPSAVIAPAAGNEAAISTRLSGLRAGGFTPINASLAQVQASGLLSDPDRGNFLLFVSDGGESCGGSDQNSTQRIAALAAQGVSTFVVGFGGGVDPGVLGGFARAGGVPNTGGGADYYQADSATELDAALGQILDSVVGCEFALAGPPDDPDAVWAFFDDVIVERDAPDGWNLSVADNKVIFVGAACQQLRSGAVADIDVVFGCPEPVLE